MCEGELEWDHPAGRAPVIAQLGIGEHGLVDEAHSQMVHQALDHPGDLIRCLGSVNDCLKHVDRLERTLQAGQVLIAPHKCLFGSRQRKHLAIFGDGCVHKAHSDLLSCLGPELDRGLVSLMDSIGTDLSLGLCLLVHLEAHDVIDPLAGCHFGIVALLNCTLPQLLVFPIPIISTLGHNLKSELRC